MSSETRCLIIPCETQAREFDAKLLLACHAAERGFEVIVGSKKSINLHIRRFPRSIYLSKALTNRNLKIYDILEKLGHVIVLGDEEGLVYPSAATYLASKVGEAAMRRGSALIAWGEENAAVWRSAPGYNGAPIFVTGNPRLDLLRMELRPRFEPEAAVLRERFGDFLLINTNFSRINHYFPAHSKQRRLLDQVDDPERDPTLVGLAAHKKELFEHFLAMVPKVAHRFPDMRIVVRPHPSEKAETWQQATRDHENVTVLLEGNIIPWLLASRCVIHNGCTTAVESFVLGVPVIAYQPVVSEQFDLDLPNSLSTRAFDITELLARVEEELLNPGYLGQVDAHERREVAQRYMQGLEGAMASERIVDVLEELWGSVPPRSQSFSRRLTGDVAAFRRSLRKRVETLIPGHRNNRTYLRHMFPGVSLQEATRTARRYGELLGRFESIQVGEIVPNVFRVTRRI